MLNPPDNKSDHSILLEKSCVEGPCLRHWIKDSEQMAQRTQLWLVRSQVPQETWVAEHREREMMKIFGRWHQE